jgi:hypothetical protein
MSAEPYNRAPANVPDADAPPPKPFDRKLSAAETERLLRLWRAGTSAHDIAVLLRIRYARVEQLVSAGVTGPP